MNATAWSNPDQGSYHVEMERMFPAAPVLSRVVEEPFEFAGFELPRGTRVLHLQTLPHFLEEVSASPYRFDPSRWMDQRIPQEGPRHLRRQHPHLPEHESGADPISGGGGQPAAR